MQFTHAIYSVKAVVDYYTNRGTTVNLFALDLKKAFDKINHFGLYMKLMYRMIPNCLLSLIEHWFSICATCVLSGGQLSCFFHLKCGVRQCGVLSPHFFAVYIDDLIKRLHRSNCGCFVRSASVNVFRLDALALSVIATATWLAVTLRYCIKTAKPIGKLFRPSESPIILVF